MTDMTHGSFESFLLEDVILTLGTLRGSLGWIAEGGEEGRAGLARLERQLAMLEDRARALCSGPHPSAAAGIAQPAPEDGLLPVFRSCRG